MIHYTKSIFEFSVTINGNGKLTKKSVLKFKACERPRSQWLAAAVLSNMIRFKVDEI